VATQQRIDLDVVVKNTQRIDRLEAALGKTQRSALSLGTAAKVAAGAIAAIGVGSALRSLVRVGSQVESLGLRFKFLFGSAEEGAKAFETLTEFAGRVPFSLEQISAASGNLAVVANDADELKNILEITGNVAAVSGLDFQTAGEQIQRALSGGIAAADIFRERGVRSLLGFKEGATATAEETRAAFQRVFGRGGEFGGATDEFAETLEGTISMLQDKLFKFQDVASREFFDELKDQLGDLNEFFEENQETIDNFARELGQGLGQAAIATGKAVIFLKENIDLVKIAIGALLALKVAIAVGNMRLAFAGLGMSLTKLLPVLRATGAVARKHPLILLGTIGAIAGIALFGDEIDKLTAKLFGNEEAMDKTIPTIDDFQSEIDETTRLKNLENQVLTGSIALYDDMTTATQIQANALKYQNEQINATAINYENLKGAAASFVDRINQLGETQAEAITRTEEERLARLKELYDKEEINKYELEDLKTKITEEATRQRIELAKKEAEANKKQYDDFLGGLRQGKLKEIDFEKLTQDQKIDIAKTGLSSILEQTATFNKKAFDLHKKVRIAEALINTYKGVTNALSAYPPPFSFIFAGAQLAFGLAQVNAIRSQSFSGRERGGPVTPGETFLVGENGPELFRPNTSGRIDNNQDTFGNTQGATVNFNISTVDAQGFDELLQSRQDLIISIINRGLTERGRARLI